MSSIALERLQKEYKKLSGECESLESEICGLQIELGDIESRREEVEDKIATLKKGLIIASVDDKPTGEPFCDLFIKASQFADRYADNGRIFGYVNTTESELIATDASRLVIIRCDIPKGLERKSLKWSVREDFLNKTEQVDSLPDCKGLVSEIRKTHEKAMVGVKATEFNEKLGVIYHSGYLRLNINGIIVFVNEGYIKTALHCLGDEPFNIYAKELLQPILLESKTMSAVVVPVRI